MHLDVFAIGSRMPAWVSDGVRNYQKRLPRHLDLRFREFSPAPRTAGSTPEMHKKREGDQILKALAAETYTIALDERGMSWRSAELAAELEVWLARESRVCFLIGGADGLDERCRERAARSWSLSPLTLPHALVRVILAEQLYRAWTLLQGHPYHRE